MPAVHRQYLASWGVLLGYAFLPFAHQLGSTPWLGCAFAPLHPWSEHIFRCQEYISEHIFSLGPHIAYNSSAQFQSHYYTSRYCIVARARGCDACHSSQWAAKRVTLSGKVARGMSGMLRRSLPSVASICFVVRCLPPLFFVLLDVAFRMRVAYCLLQDISCCVAHCLLLYVGCLLLRVEPMLIVARILLVDYCWLPCCTLLIVACCFLLLLVAHV